MTRNPNWTRDELILALDLYMSAGRKQLDSSDPRVIDLSQLLNRLPIHPVEFREAEFRNPNGVSMKLGNFSGIDPEYSGVGLSQGSKLEKEVWDEFADSLYQLTLVANTIRKQYKHVKEAGATYEFDDEEFIEGQLLTRLHKQKERNPKLVKLKKEAVLRLTGKLLCEVCEFDFASVYGTLGFGYAECHHLIPLANLNEEKKTKLSDLAIVCANCHRMLHRSKEMLSIEELRKIIWENMEDK